mgnify:CR=1 FL=1
MDTPVGSITATLYANGEVSVALVPCYRQAKSVSVDVPGAGRVTGDVAWGGNWFFLIREHYMTLDQAHLEQLTDFATLVRDALSTNGIRGAKDAEIDHIELFSPSETAESRHFVLCPGAQYDRSA